MSLTGVSDYKNMTFSDSVTNPNTCDMTVRGTDLEKNIFCEL